MEIVLDCGCDGYLGNKAGALYQDRVYGPGKRVHNPTAKEDMFRCTVCLRERGRPQRTLSKREQKELREKEKAEKAEKAAKNRR